MSGRTNRASGGQTPSASSQPMERFDYPGVDVQDWRITALHDGEADVFLQRRVVGPEEYAMDQEKWYLFRVQDGRAVLQDWWLESLDSARRPPDGVLPAVRRWLEDHGYTSIGAAEEQR